MTDMKALFDDAIYWHDHDTYPAHERAVRVHHRLVSVHPFRNGNGRHSRFFADLYVYEVGAAPLTWGAGRNLVVDSETRMNYIQALVEADRGDLDPLLSFATA